MESTHILVFSANFALPRDFATFLSRRVEVTHVSDARAFEEVLATETVSLVMLDAALLHGGLDLTQFGTQLEGVPLILLTQENVMSVDLLNQLAGLPLYGGLSRRTPLEEIRRQVERALQGHLQLRQTQHLNETVPEANTRRQARLQEINAIYTVGKSVTSSLDSDEVLARVVMAAVDLTQADGGFIVLQEDDQLFVRVAKHPSDSNPEYLHGATNDSVAWQVIRSERPAMLHRETRVATGLLVRALLYVPLKTINAGTIGILGVINRERDKAFTEHQLFTLSSIADFAAIALANARLFSLVQAERSRLSAVLKHAAEAVIVTDTDHCLWLWSETAAEIFDLNRDVRGAPLEAHIDNPEIQALFVEAQDDVPVLHTEVELRDGRVYNTQLSTIAGIGCVVVMQDITYLKELDHLRSEFVSTVSHDLRTPLTTIQGYVELLDRVGPLNEMQISFIDKALRSLNHITALISDLLDIGRIEAGHELEMQELQMDELISTATEAAAVGAAERDIELSTDLADMPLCVWGNPRRLTQVLHNLISNAVKYNHPGGWVHVKARRDEEHIVVSVSDSGIGIAPQDQARIFDRFYRVESPETDEIQGTGLGLAIVKSVVEKHRGRVWVESTPGQGSAFAFLLPVHDAASRPAPDRRGDGS